MSLAITFIVASSMSIFLMSFFNKNFENGIHLSFLGSLFILYTFGIFNNILLGTYVLTIVVGLLYLASFINIIKNKQIKQIIKCLFTDGFFVFIILYFLCYFVTKDRIPSSWDEFSHWCDTVKTMYIYDDLPTNQLYYASYPHYPPGISLLQYYFLKLENNFNEEIIYFVQKVFALSLIVPFVKNSNKLNTKLNPILNIILSIIVRIFKILLIAISSFVIITMFDSTFYNTSYIDTFLGIVFGFGFIYIFLFDIKDPINFITICLTIFALCIIKEAGTTFGVSLSIILIIEIIKNKFNKNLTLGLAGATIFSSVYPLLSWSQHIARHEVTQVSDRNFSLFMLFSLGRNEGDEYRIETLNNFYEKLFLKDLEIFPKVSLVTSHFMIFAIMLTIFIIIFMYHIKYYIKIKENNNNIIKNNIIKNNLYIILGLYLVFIIYTVGLLISYMYFFSPYEAVALASFDRYMFILYTAFVVFALAYVINIFSFSYKNIIFCSSILVFNLAIFDYSGIKESFEKNNYIWIVPDRQRLEDVVSNFKNVSNPEVNENILAVVQNTNGFKNRQLKYLIRPDNITEPVFSFGMSYHDGDIWSIAYSPEQWEKFIFDKLGYEYIIMLEVDLQFLLRYKETFENPEDVKNNSIFKINQEKRIIETVFSDPNIEPIEFGIYKDAQFINSTTLAITVNNNPVKLSTYMTDSNNFINIRDLAYILNNTNKNFEVTWNDEIQSIEMFSNTTYTTIGNEMEKSDDIPRIAILSEAEIYIDGEPVILSTYEIDDNNYFKLRDIMEIFDVYVGWNAYNNSVILDTSKSYEQP